MPSAFALMPELNAFTISLMLEVVEPVHWYEQPSRLHASAAPYCVGTKKGFVVTWLTNTNFHFGCDLMKACEASASDTPPKAGLATTDAGSESAAAPSPTRLSRLRRDATSSWRSSSSTCGASSPRESSSST